MTKKWVIEVEPAREGTDGQPALGPAYTRYDCKDGNPTKVGYSTLYEMFAQSSKKFASHNCLGYRPIDEKGNAGDYVFSTYQEVAQKVDAVASALAKEKQVRGCKVGVYGLNCPEWMIAMQACNRMSYLCVPVYDTLGENAVTYILDHAESTSVFCSGEKLGEVAKSLVKLKPRLTTVVYWGKAKSEEIIEAVKKTGRKIYSFDEFVALGQGDIVAPDPPKADDLCTIMYTSGTTGTPKGVMISHQAIISQVVSNSHVQKEAGVATTEKDVFLSFLPLAHIFDRVVEETMISMGASIGYWRGNVKLLVDDIAALRPTTFCAVPRVYDRIYQGVKTKLGESKFKRRLFNYGYARKLYFMQHGQPSKSASPFFDKLLFKKIAARLGGKVKLIISGGAPLSPHVEEFLRVAFCAVAVQGYGLTETCAGGSVAIPDEMEQSGTVGVPQASAWVRLEAVPEMNYDPLASPPRGELLIKGPCLFSGYYKQQEKTDEVLTKDGWFHTGDIAEFSESGIIKIIDRKKNIFKLAQGEYVAVEKLEGSYKKCPYVEQIWVYGNSFESALVAVVVPTQPLAKFAGVSSVDELVGNEAASKELLEALQKTGKDEKLKGFEIIKAVHIEKEQFSVENDLLTATFKLKRNVLLKAYQVQVDKMYAAIKESAK